MFNLDHTQNLFYRTKELGPIKSGKAGKVGKYNYHIAIIQSSPAYNKTCKAALM